MSIQRSALTRGPAIVTTTLTTLRTLYTNGDINFRLNPVWQDVITSMYGRVDRFVKDRVYKLPMRLWGSWDNLDLLFPSYALAPQPGTSIFGTTDTPWAITARNGDKITLTCAAITKLANLYLGVDQDLFVADVELTAIIGNGKNPEDANAYYTVATGAVYADGAFSKANYKKSRFTGAWGALTGFTAIAAQKGFQVSWELDAKPLVADGLGTVDFTVGQNGLAGTCTCIPIGNTMANLEAQASAQGVSLGTLLSGLAADLVLTAQAGAPIITLKHAAITEHGYAFGVEPLRQGPVTWATTRGFTAGVPDAVSTVA